MPFPRFDDGDVSIRLNAEDEPWVLHSCVLALHSPWFKASLSERWDVAAHENGSRCPRHYELRFEKDSDDGAFMRAWGDGMELLTTNPQDSDQSVPAGLNTKRVQILLAHQKLLNAMYHVEWDQAVLNGDGLDFFRAAVSIADFYSCSNVMGPRVDYMHRRNDKRYLKSCKSEPVEMLGLEAKKKRLEVDRRLFCFSYDDNELEYDPLLALAIWRQWLAEEMGKSSTGVYYHIHAADARVIDLADKRRAELATHADTPCLRENLETLFNIASDIVWPVMVDRTKLRSTKDKNEPLAFHTISESDLPWKAKPSKD